MSLFTLPFDPAIGPIWAIGVSFPQSSWPDAINPPPMKRINMLIDTGASFTSISTAVATELALPILGQQLVRSVTHEQAVNLYIGDMHLPVPDGSQTPFVLPLRDVQFAEFPQGNDTIHGLLGRDIFRNCLFTMNGKARTFTVAF